MVFDIYRTYKQNEILKEIGEEYLKQGKPISAERFRNSWRTRKGFPKPIIDQKTYKVWRGSQLANFMHKV